MRQQLLHTPEGVRDIYNGECEKKMVLQDHLQQYLKELRISFHREPRPLSFLIYSEKRSERSHRESFISSLTGRAIRWCYARI